MTMTKKEMILEAIESLGYKPHVDDDGDICVRFQMKSIFFLTGKEEELNEQREQSRTCSDYAESREKKTGGQQYISAILPQFSEVNEGEETLTLAVCNKVSREVKLAKVYIDQSLKSVTASCEFFYTDMESLKNNVEHVLNILGMVRSAYNKTKAEFSAIE